MSLTREKEREREREGGGRVADNELLCRIICALFMGYILINFTYFSSSIKLVGTGFSTYSYIGFFI